MKGIILAGGSGTRLYPLTKATSKQLLPIYDKPMIYYPLSTLMLAKIHDILIISTPSDIPNFKNLLGNGSKLGIKLSYEVQTTPDGIAQAFLIGREFVGNDTCALILGDNIFYGGFFSDYLSHAVNNAENGHATIFGYYVNDPERFGIVEFDDNKNIISIEEKPKSPKSNYCITGLYFYDNKVLEYAQQIHPSARGELEITDLNQIYLNNHALKVELLGRGFAWLDTGTTDSLYEASEFIHTIQKRQGIILSAPEEIAYHNEWISKNELINLSKNYRKSSYGDYLLSVAESNVRWTKT